MIIRIVGRGPVALAFGLLLRRQGIPAARIELDTDDSPLPPHLAARTLALSAGSWQLLGRLYGGNGPGSAPPPAASIEAIDVSLQGRAGRTHLEASELKVPALGYVVRYADLWRSLRSAAAPAGFAAPLSLGRHSEALVVHAEGESAGSLSGDTRDHVFEQSAIVAEVTMRCANHVTAYERFTDQGPLALLPLPEADRYALVWCCRPEQAERRLSLDEPTFIAELAGMLGSATRPVRLASARHQAPLTRRQRMQTVDDHQVWIGNAAQALHPVAGQGFNLGLRDAFVLARELGLREDPAVIRASIEQQGHEPAHAGSHALPPELMRALQRYRQARRHDRSMAIGVTDMLARIFTVRALQAAESVALSVLDLSTHGRQLVARQMMFGQR